MNSAAIIKSVIIYALCVPLAVFVGYQLSDPLTYSAFGVVGLLALLLAFPLVLRSHHLLLLLSWNMTAMVFFIKGRPQLWMVMVILSLGISVLQRAASRDMRFVVVPRVVLPLLFLLAVVLMTAKLTGGIGLRALGSDVYGGRRYVVLIAAIASYFALTAQRIPQERAGLYVGAFFLGGLTGAISDLFTWMPSSLQFIFWIFPPNIPREGLDVEATRLLGIPLASAAVYYFMLSRYGIRGIFSMKKPWRAALFVLFTLAGLYGGFRSIVIIFGLTFVFLFFCEGLHRTKMLFGVILSVVLAGAAIVPLAPKLPYSFQRALAFLPLEIDPLARMDAEGSIEWRLRIWNAMLPQVPQHLLLGKGYALSPTDFDFAAGLGGGGPFEENSLSSISTNYHNGPLSVILPFGIWGVIAFLWFISAAIRVLYRNYRHSPATLQTINALIFASFVAKTLMFVFLFGSLDADMLQFAGLLGLSISLNGGVLSPSPAVVSEPQRGQVEAFPRPVFQQ